MSYSSGILNRSKVINPLDKHFVRKFVEGRQLPFGCFPAGQFVKPCGTFHIFAGQINYLFNDITAAFFIAPPPVFLLLCFEVARLHCDFMLPTLHKAISLVPRPFELLFLACPADSHICGGCGGQARGFAPALNREASSQSSRSFGRGQPIRGRNLSTPLAPNLSPRCRPFQTRHEQQFVIP